MSTTLLNAELKPEILDPQARAILAAFGRVCISGIADARRVRQSALNTFVSVSRNRNNEFFEPFDSKLFQVTKIGSFDSLSKSIELADSFGEAISLDRDGHNSIHVEILPRLFGRS